ncbi:hypothetical protein LAZ67_2002740 [Cordylochernes scorpioides]|uniref:Transposase Tc1-like domain-containing protein n=1 Tax=Cordylochernes scorpioides TaxID=51811 RepID=A0ABY6K538_9ARAC|nr:hypothetical protein LAZ67_2002740 [Cordylochernes scorpioides]
MPGHRKRRQFKQTDVFTRDMVIGLKRAGWSIHQIAADTHLGTSTVHRLWRRWLEQGNVAIYRNVGATRVTSARVDRRILRQAVAAPQATCTAILQHVQDTLDQITALDHSISTRTISRRLVANGLHSCRPLRRLPLTPPNRLQRLEWCRDRSTWMTEWHRVVFSDESRFCLSSDSRRVRVWRRRGERSNPAAIVERPTVRQRVIMVWGAIAYVSRSPLLRIQGTMTAQRYVDDVLRPVTLPYLQGVPNALYHQDNARPHTARISQQALQDQRIPGCRQKKQLQQTVDFTRGMVIGFRLAGGFIRQIFSDRHLDVSIVHRLWQIWLERGNLARLRGSGAVKVTSAHVDRRIRRMWLAATKSTAILSDVQDVIPKQLYHNTTMLASFSRVECRGDESTPGPPLCTGGYPQVFPGRIFEDSPYLHECGYGMKNKFDLT